MSNTETKQSTAFRELFAKLPESEKRYVLGWMAAKADTHKQEKKTAI